jgi:predicted HTH transcriptional regulator
LLPEIDKVELGKDKFIVYAKVPSNAPCLYQGKVFIRVGSTSVEASGGDELKSLLNLKNFGAISPRPPTA